MVFTLLAGSHAHAQVLVSGQGVSIDTKEIQMELERFPAEGRAQLSSPAAMQNNVANIYARRVLAKDAVKEGLHTNPLVIAAIEKAKDRILSDAMLEKIDQKNQPTLQDLEAWAQASYKANPKKYEQPEQVRASHILIERQNPMQKPRLRPSSRSCATVLISPNWPKTNHKILEVPPRVVIWDFLPVVA